MALQDKVQAKCYTIDLYKARFVAKGFTQVTNKDYKHTFSPPTKLPIVRVLEAVVMINHCSLHELDVNNAFLHGHSMRRCKFYLLKDIQFSCRKGVRDEEVIIRP